MDIDIDAPIRVRLELVSFLLYNPCNQREATAEFPVLVLQAKKVVKNSSSQTILPYGTRTTTVTRRTCYLMWGFPRLDNGVHRVLEDEVVDLIAALWWKLERVKKADGCACVHYVWRHWRITRMVEEMCNEKYLGLRRKEKVKS